MKRIKTNLQIDSKVNNNGEGLLYLNFNYGYSEININTGKKRYRPLKLSTGYRIKKEDLIQNNISKKYITKHGNTIKVDILNIEETCESCLKTHMKNHKNLPNPKVLKELVNAKLNGLQSTSNEDSITEFINKLITRNKNTPNTSKEYLSDSTIKEYRNTKIKLKEVEKLTGIQYEFSSFTKDIYLECLSKINDIEKKRQKSEHITVTGYTNNYISKISKNILAILNKASEDGKDIPFNTRGKKVNEVSSMCSTYFTDEELNLILNTDVSHSKTLESAKNYILISSLTGLRLEDMLHLHELSIEKLHFENNDFYIFSTLIRKVSTAREPVLATIPVFKPVLDIYKKNKNQFPKFQRNIHQYIKKLCKHLEIDVPVEVNILYYLDKEFTTSFEPKYNMLNAHKCRNSFVTNLKLLKIPSNLIQAITHPKKDIYNMSSRYDNSDSKDLAKLFIQQINSLPSKSSNIYIF